MSRKHNWKETDDLVAKLRAKIHEETSEAESAGTAEPSSGEPLTSVPAPETEQEEPILPPEGKKKHRRKRSAPAEEREVFRTENALSVPDEQTSEKNTGTAAVPLTPEISSVPPKPAAEDESAPEAEEKPATKEQEPAPMAEEKPGPKEQEPAPKAEEPEEDTVAALTVENMLDSIFDAVRDENGNRLFDEQGKAVHTKEPAKEKRPPETAQPPRSADGFAEPPVPARADGQKEPQEERRSGIEVTEEEYQRILSSLNGRGKRSADAVRPGLRETPRDEKEDLKLLLELDYEDELGSAIGFEKIRAYREQGIIGETAEAIRERNKQKKHEKREFELRGQDVYFNNQYKKQKKGLVWRLALSVALFLLIFIYEHPAWLPLLFRGPLDGAAYPRSYILFGIQLFLVDAALFYQRIRRGIVSFFRFSPTDDSLGSITVLLTFFYHIVLVFLPAGGTCPTLYLSPAAMELALLSFSDWIDWYREYTAFRVVSNRGQKFALLPIISVGGSQNNARERLLENESDEAVWYVSPVEFVRNYFANTDKRVEHIRSLGFQLLLVCAVGLAFGLFELATDAGAGMMARTVFVTFLVCLPSVSMLVTSLPMFLATVLHLKQNGAIVGEEPVYRSGGKTALVLPDDEVIEQMIHEQFEVLQGHDEVSVRVYVHALLQRIRSPLRDTVDVVAELRIPPEQVVLTEIGETGVSALVGHKRAKVCMGSETYLKERGLSIPQAEEQEERAHRQKLLVAIDGTVCAVFYARYRLAEEMLKFLTHLSGEDVQIVVRSKDPGVNGELMKQLNPNAAVPLRVMKPTAREMDIGPKRADATIVAIGSCRAAAGVFLICRRIRKAGIFGKWLQIFFMVLGALGMGLLTLFGRLQTISPAAITLYIFCWCLIDGAASYLFLRNKENS